MLGVYIRSGGEESTRERTHAALDPLREAEGRDGSKRLVSLRKAGLLFRTEYVSTTPNSRNPCDSLPVQNILPLFENCSESHQTYWTRVVQVGDVFREQKVKTSQGIGNDGVD